MTPVPLHMTLTHFGASPFTSQRALFSTSTSRSAWRVERLRKRDLDDENRLPATTLPEGQKWPSGANEFNDLENRESRGTSLRDAASRKRVGEALKFLDRNLHGLRRGTAKHEHLIGRVRASRRPLSTAKAICRDYLKVDQRGPECDPSDVQELWVKVFKRQGRLIYPEQERIFRDLDRLALRGSLSSADLDRADKTLRLFKAPGSVNHKWAKAELLTDVALSSAGVS